jgi:hypothetical protein
MAQASQPRFRLAARLRRVWFFLPCAVWLLAAGPLFAGNFFSGITPATVPWANGIVPYAFTNTLTASQQQTYLAGLREWELAANVKFVPYTSQSRWILFTYNTNNFDNFSVGYSPQVVSVGNLGRAQVCHEMGHSFGFAHENIRIDQTNYLTVLTNNIYDESSNIIWFTIDPTTETNGAYDFQSVMHLGNNFVSVDPANLYTQQARPAYVEYQPRMGNLCLSKGDRAALSFLYGPPLVPLTNIVATTADYGSGSLRAALYYATDHPGTTIRFNIPTSDAGYSNGVFTIHLSGYLPPLVTGGTVIDGSTQPGFSGKPLVIVDGSQLIPEAYPPSQIQVTGLQIFAANCQVKNLSFQNFDWNGVTLSYPYATNNTISGCWMGLDYTGTNPAPNAFQGIFINLGASGNLIGGTNALARNVLSGNTQYGIWLGTNSTGNVILGNYIGTDYSGSRAVSNAFGGMILAEGTGFNTIGGTNAGAGNVISGNVANGVLIGGPNVASNTVEGNFIGTDATGMNPLPNSFTGVLIASAATFNVIGGTVPGARNVISGNANSYGVVVAGPGTSFNQVAGNYIGLGSNGLATVPNYYGMMCAGGATSNTFGGTVAGARNIISGNDGYGMMINDPGTSGNVVEGNYIGLDAGGVTAVPDYYGVLCYNAATNNLIGGTSAGAANFISGNYLYGVSISGPGTSGNMVEGNFIGTDRTGTNGVGNYDNVELDGGASGNFIGGVGAGAGNVIAFAGWTGVILYNTDTTNNSIRGNSIFNNPNSDTLGIHLVGTNDFYPYVTTNHVGDGVPGPNDLQNFPVITNAFGYATSTIIMGTLNSLTNRSFFIDVYRSFSPDTYTIGYGQGQFYVGSVSLNTDINGNGAFALTNHANYAGQYFTATATAANGDTSEFSLAVQATNAPAPSAIFTGPYLARTNGFTFTLDLQTNYSYHIQAATNLAQNPVAWVSLTNFTATNSIFNFTDHTATNYHQRFYQVTSP